LFAYLSCCRSSIDNNVNLAGFLPSSWRQRNPFNMVYAVDFSISTGNPVLRGPDNYGSNGATLYTGSGPLWRTKLTNWEGLPDNAAVNPNPQPNPDPCKVDPFSNLICQ
jgi:hypothetical protein